MGLRRLLLIVLRVVLVAVGVLVLLVAALFMMRGREPPRYGFRLNSDLRYLRDQQDRYFAANAAYSSDLSRLGVTLRPGASIAVTATATSWSAIARDARWPGKSCVVWGGSLPPDERPATEEERRTYPPDDVACDDNYFDSVADRWAAFYMEPMPALLRRFSAQQERHFGRHGRYALNVSELRQFTADSAMTVTWTHASDSGWVATVTHPGAPQGQCAMWAGAVPPALRPKSDYKNRYVSDPVPFEEAGESVPACALAGYMFDYVPPVFYDPDSRVVDARVWMTHDLRALVRAQSAHFRRHGRYAATAASLTDYKTSPGVTLEQFDGDAYGWRATARHGGAQDESCVVWGGALTAGTRPATMKERRTYQAGVPACDGDRRSVESAMSMAHLDSVASALRRLVRNQERYLARHGRYATRLDTLPPIAADSAIRIELVLHDRVAWAGVGSHLQSPQRRCTSWAGRIARNKLPDTGPPWWADEGNVICVDAFELKDR